MKEIIRAPALLPSLVLQHSDPGISFYSSGRSVRKRNPILKVFSKPLLVTYLLTFHSTKQRQMTEYIAPTHHTK
jgi:hypothetical protein